jgi:DME family drug/metabolite transporter
VWRGYLYVAIATFCWGLAAVAARAIFSGRLLPAAHAAEISPLVLSQTRASISWVLLAPLLVAARQLRLAPIAVPSRRQFFASLALGCMAAGSNFFYYFSVQQTSVAVGIMLQYLAPVWVLAYLVARHQQRATAARVSGVVLAVAGCGLAVGIAPGRAHFAILGVLAGLGASFAFGGYNVLGRALVEKLDRWTVLYFSLFGTTALWFVINPWHKLAQEVHGATQWEFLLGFAVFSVLIPYALFFAGLQYLDATRAIVTSCLEPVFAIALAWMLLGERITSLQILGIISVLAGTIVVQRQ